MELECLIEEIVLNLSNIAKDNVSNTKETNSLITEVADCFGKVEEAAQNLRETAKRLEKEVQNFNMD